MDKTWNSVTSDRVLGMHVSVVRDMWILFLGRIFSNAENEWVSAFHPPRIPLNLVWGGMKSNFCADHMSYFPHWIAAWLNDWTLVCWSVVCPVVWIMFLTLVFNVTSSQCFRTGLEWKRDKEERNSNDRCCYFNVVMYSIKSISTESWLWSEKRELQSLPKNNWS